MEILVRLFLGRAREAQLAPPPGPLDFRPLVPENDDDEDFFDDDEEEEGRTDHIIGESPVIRYLNSAGEESRRRIAVHAVYERNGTHYLRAYCYERGAPRLFRHDRILEILDAESGEVIESLTGIAEAVADLADPLDSIEATRRAFKLHRRGILVLLFLARCDGCVHPSEEQVLLGYIDDACGRNGVDEAYARSRLKRLSPDPDAYQRLVHTLKTTGKLHDGRTRLYRSSKHDCDPCPLKPQCCPKAPHRKIPRDIHEDSRDVARALYDTPAFAQSRRERKRVEMLFAHLKRILKLGRLRLRGPCGAQDEFLLAATAQNLRKLAKLRPEPPPCAEAA